MYDDEKLVIRLRHIEFNHLFNEPTHDDPLLYPT